jgi:hypothetical protein
MRFRTFLLATFGVVLLATFVANMSYNAGKEAQQILIDQTLGNLDNHQVTVPASAAGATNVAPTGAVGVGAIAIQNTSTSCIRCGGVSNVGSSAGIQIGDGCAAGKFLPLDVANAHCVAEADAGVAIDVGYGQR